jgi:hypothetical protein
VKGGILCQFKGRARGLTVTLEGFLEVAHDRISRIGYEKVEKEFQQGCWAQEERASQQR